MSNKIDCSLIMDDLLELKHVMFVFRHGDRAPIASRIGQSLFVDDAECQYWLNQLVPEEEVKKADKFAKVVGEHIHLKPAREPILSGKWPLGQLTSRGAKQMQEKGRKLRLRYHEFIHQAVQPEAIYVRSTNIHRTIMSAQNFLLGMFPEYIDCSEPAFHIRTLDPIIMAPKHSKINMIQLSQKLSYLTSDHPIHLETLENTVRASAGVHSDQPMEWAATYEVLVCRRNHGLPIPEGISDQVHEQIAKYTYWQWKSMHSHNEMGPTMFADGMKEIHKRIESVLAEFQHHLVTIFSAHDSTLVALLCALGIDLGHIPHYASVITLEILEHRQSKARYIRLLFEDQELHLPGHSHSSIHSLDYFYDIVHRFLSGQGHGASNAAISQKDNGQKLD